MKQTLNFIYEIVQQSRKMEFFKHAPRTTVSFPVQTQNIAFLSSQPQIVIWYDVFLTRHRHIKDIDNLVPRSSDPWNVC